MEQFNDADFVDKLVGFMALEEKQGEDLFNAMSFGLFHVSWLILINDDRWN